MKNAKSLLLLPLLMLVSGVSFAAGPDFTTMTSGVDFTTVVTAILAIGLAGVGVILAYRGVKHVWGAIRGA